VVDTNDDEGVPKAPELSPPTGYESWLECAVALFDPTMASAALNDAPQKVRSQVQKQVWSEFNALRSKAGMPQRKPRTSVPPQQDLRSLLEMRDAIPQREGIDFEPVVIGAEKVDFNPDR
jgi:hypothetical protein